MSEYIKKKDAIESARALLFCYGSDNISDEQLDEYAEEFMNDDNTIIEVVRCKDCKWWKAKPNEDEEDNESNGFATWYDGNKLCHICGNGNDFCSYGKRKDNE